MNLKEYAQRVVNTTKDDWTVITCWGFGSGPSYLESASVWTRGKDAFSGIEIESHSMRASLKLDLSVSIAWGFPAVPEFKEPWANQFPDSAARSGFVDFFYNGTLVFRDLYVSVDGGRCLLPLPDLEFDPKTHEILRYTVPRDKYTFFRTLDGFEKISDFDRYFRATGFVIVDGEWMS